MCLLRKKGANWRCVMRSNLEVSVHNVKHPSAYLLYATWSYYAGTYLVFQCVPLVKGKREEENHVLRLQIPIKLPYVCFIEYHDR